MPSTRFRADELIIDQSAIPRLAHFVTRTFTKDTTKVHMACSCGLKVRSGMIRSAELILLAKHRKHGLPEPRIFA